MATRKKKTVPKKKKAAKKKTAFSKKAAPAKRIPQKKSAPAKRTSSPKRTKLPPLDKASNKEIIVQVIEIERSGGRDKSLDMILVHTERYRTSNQVFDIHTHRDEKRPRLIIDAYKVTPEGKEHPKLLRKILKADPSAKTLKRHAGYAETMAELKKELETIPVN